jgi:hypothetical protein
MLPRLTPSPAQGKPKTLLEEVRDLMRLRHYGIRVWKIQIMCGKCRSGIIS